MPGIGSSASGDEQIQQLGVSRGGRCYGLSMDHEEFLLSRVREEHVATGGVIVIGNGVDDGATDAGAREESHGWRLRPRARRHRRGRSVVGA